MFRGIRAWSEKVDATMPIYQIMTIKFNELTPIELKQN